MCSAHIAMPGMALTIDWLCSASIFIVVVVICFISNCLMLSLYIVNTIYYTRQVPLRITFEPNTNEYNIIFYMPTDNRSNSTLFAYQPLIFAYMMIYNNFTIAIIIIM